jgi:hypothetical protein
LPRGGNSSRSFPGAPLLGPALKPDLACEAAVFKNPRNIFMCHE